MILKKVARRTIRMSKSVIGCIRLHYKATSNVVSEKKNVITLINTQKDSDNLGDNIIMKYARQALNEILQGEVIYEVASHCPASDKDIEVMLSSKAVIVCGTNFLYPHMEEYGVWKFDERMINIKNMVLLGVGWSGGIAGLYSSYVFRKLFKNNYLHSVRDQYTADNLSQIGVKNVINTNCVTLWGLDTTCAEIPIGKANSVVTTVTEYRNDRAQDIFMLTLLQELYDNVYFWPQGSKDLEYVRTLVNLDKITVLDRSLDAYERTLELPDIDYVGSRLHGGIYALRHNKRTIIIAVDNRAREIHRDTGIPVIESADVRTNLKNMVLSEWSTNVVLNTDSATLWVEALRNKIKEV